jgi:hypothetical protein
MKVDYCYKCRYYEWMGWCKYGDTLQISYVDGKKEKERNLCETKRRAYTDNRCPDYERAGLLRAAWHTLFR